MRAKFVVIERSETIKGGEIALVPVTSGSPENEKFFKFTPYGKIEIGLIDPEVIKKFTPGKEYYVEFIPLNT